MHLFNGAHSNVIQIEKATWRHEKPAVTAKETRKRGRDEDTRECTAPATNSEGHKGKKRKTTPSVSGSQLLDDTLSTATEEAANQQQDSSKRKRGQASVQDTDPYAELEDGHRDKRSRKAQVAPNDSGISAGDTHDSGEVYSHMSGQLGAEARQAGSGTSKNETVPASNDDFSGKGLNVNVERHPNREVSPELRDTARTKESNMINNSDEPPRNTPGQALDQHNSETHENSPALGGNTNTVSRKPGVNKRKVKKATVRELTLRLFEYD